MLRREVDDRSHIAETLRKTRERLDLTIERAAADAGVPLRYARLLEGEPPSGVGVSDELYLIPFFRRYARALGLPAEELLPDFLGQVQDLPPPSTPRLQLRAGRRRGVFWKVATAGLAIGAATFVILQRTPEAPTTDEWSDHGALADADGTHLRDDADAAAPAVAQPGGTGAEHDGAVASEPAREAPASEDLAGQPDATTGREPATPLYLGNTAPRAPQPAPAPQREDGSQPPGRSRPAGTTNDGVGRDAPAPAPNAVPANAASNATAAAQPDGNGAGRELRIVAAEQTWLSLAIDDEPKRNILLQPGEARSWTAARGFTLTVGNAGGITVSLDGRELPPLGRSGQVVRNLRLPQGEAPPASG